ARLCEQCIKYDMEESGRVGAAPRRELAELPDLLVPDETAVKGAPRPVQMFEPKVLKATAAEPLRVRPLLTPDEYAADVLDLIEKAKSRVFFQNQYIKAWTKGSQLERLVKALLAKARAGLDVKSNLRDGAAGPMVQVLKRAGFDTGDPVRLQTGCHKQGR